MPNQIPLKVIVRQSVSSLGSIALLLLRSFLVVCVWFLALPTATLWTWRFYFWSGENIGFKQAITEDSSGNSVLFMHYNWRYLYKLYATDKSILL
jgi:hypothetical protein